MSSKLTEMVASLQGSFDGGSFFLSTKCNCFYRDKHVQTNIGDMSVASRLLLTWRLFEASSRSQVCMGWSPFLRLDSQSLIPVVHGVDWVGKEIKVTISKFWSFHCNSHVTGQLTWIDLGTSEVFKSANKTKNRHLIRIIKYYNPTWACQNLTLHKLLWIYVQANSPHLSLA